MKSWRFSRAGSAWVDDECIQNLGRKIINAENGGNLVVSGRIILKQSLIIHRSKVAQRMFQCRAPMNTTMNFKSQKRQELSSLSNTGFLFHTVITQRFILHLCIHLEIYLYIYPPIHRSIHTSTYLPTYLPTYLRSRIQKFPAWHTKAAPNGKCCEGYIVPSMVRLMYQLKSVLK